MGSCFHLCPDNVFCSPFSSLLQLLPSKGKNRITPALLSVFPVLACSVTTARVIIQHFHRTVASSGQRQPCSWLIWALCSWPTWPRAVHPVSTGRPAVPQRQLFDPGGQSFLSESGVPLTIEWEAPDRNLGSGEMMKPVKFPFAAFSSSSHPCPCASAPLTTPVVPALLGPPGAVCSCVRSKPKWKAVMSTALLHTWGRHPWRDEVRRAQPRRTPVEEARPGPLFLVMVEP